MKRRESKKHKNDGAPKWMVTYSDMVTLILVFFILLFSMSQIDIAKFDAISDSFKNRVIFDFYPSPMPMENPTENTSHDESGKNTNEFSTPSSLDKELTKKEEVNEKDSLDELMEAVQEYLEQNDLEKLVTATRTGRGVILVLQESILFDSGEADIVKSGKPLLNEISNLLTNLANPVNVEGHTDNRPISNYRYPSNWELSGARASGVIRYLVDANDFDQSRFTAVGYGDTRPLVDNNTTSNWSKNRRVEIVILEE